MAPALLVMGKAERIGYAEAFFIAISVDIRLGGNRVG
jgi:antirestriction protein ArdC